MRLAGFGDDVLVEPDDVFDRQPRRVRPSLSEASHILGKIPIGASNHGPRSTPDAERPAVFFTRVGFAGASER